MSEYDVLYVVRVEFSALVEVCYARGHAQRASCTTESRKMLDVVHLVAPLVHARAVFSVGLSITSAYHLPTYLAALSSKNTIRSSWFTPSTCTCCCVSPFPEHILEISSFLLSPCFALAGVADALGAMRSCFVLCLASAYVDIVFAKHPVTKRNVASGRTRRCWRRTRSSTAGWRTA